MGVTVPAPAMDVERHEALLVAAARDGDDRAFERLYAGYRDRIHAFILSRVRDHGRAEDLGQEVFMAALRQLRATEAEIAFKPWLYTIARNACVDEFRRGTRSREVPTDSEETLESVAGDVYRFRAAPSPAAAIDSKQELEDLRGAFGGLNENQHRLIVMREFEGLSYDEIGERLGMTRQMVESGLFRARRKLSEEYDELASGRRCAEVQSSIDGGRLARARGLGVKERRRVTRHLSHCQPCRHAALGAQVDAALLQRRSLTQRVAALLPLPLLRKLWEFMHGGGSGGGGAGGGGAAAAGGGGAAAGGVAAGAAGGGVGLGGAAASAAVVLAGAGGGVALGEHSGADHHHLAPVAITRHSAGAGTATAREGVGGPGAGTRHAAATPGGGAAVAASGHGSGSLPARSSSAAPGGTGAGGSGGTHSGGGGGGAGATGAGSAGGIGTTVSGVTTRAGSAVSGVTNGARTTVSGVTNGVRTTVNGTTSGIRTTVSGVTNGVKTTVNGTTNGVRTTVSGVANGVRTTVSGVTSGSPSGVTNGVKTTVSGVTDGVKTTASGVTNGAGATASGVTNGVRTTVNGVATGIASTLGGLLGG